MSASKQEFQVKANSNVYSVLETDATRFLVKLHTDPSVRGEFKVMKNTTDGRYLLLALGDSNIPFEDRDDIALQTIAHCNL